MISLSDMTKKRISLLLIATVFSFAAFAQPSHAVTDPEKKFKDAKELFVQGQYALAYPMLAELKTEFPDNTASEHNYLNDDVNYYYTVCQLQLQQPAAEKEAKHFIEVVKNVPRRQLMSYYLAKFYFAKEDFNNALQNYEVAGYANLDNAAIADAKFEKAYSYFNLKMFEQAKPLFDGIRQLEDNKYYYPANYYFGFISFNDHEYDNAMRSFKIIENQDAYKSVVPYYIAEILYFQKKFDEALKYGQSILDRGDSLYYRDEMNLLIGQLYFEKKDYEKALPLLAAYVAKSDKVTKQVLYELSYCYYEAKELEKAIEGFKQLSTEKDSMGQNSMYL
ncbi:MAG TPA: tetratricopeptide repeat protein, partial [Ferruginibacter sp.]|nr:tetratricopeptide repeat protein [Ferruginibacter sp.]